MQSAAFFLFCCSDLLLPQEAFVKRDVFVSLFAGVVLLDCDNRKKGTMIRERRLKVVVSTVSAYARAIGKTPTPDIPILQQAKAEYARLQSPSCHRSLLIDLLCRPPYHSRQWSRLPNSSGRLYPITAS